jgi:hypothetical protein
MSCEKKYVMAVISMPIKVVDLASGDFECMQEYSSITIADCDPDILKTKPDNGYENLGDKILEFLEKKTPELTLLELEKGLDSPEVKPETEMVSSNRPKVKNKTFRKFHSGRKYTLRNWKALGIHGNFP